MCACMHACVRRRSSCWPRPPTTLSRTELSATIALPSFLSSFPLPLLPHFPPFLPSPNTEVSDSHSCRLPWEEKLEVRPRQRTLSPQGVSSTNEPKAGRTGKVSSGDPREQSQELRSALGSEGRAGCWVHNPTQTLSLQPSRLCAGELWEGEPGWRFCGKETGSCLVRGRSPQTVLCLPPAHELMSLVWGRGLPLRIITATITNNLYLMRLN